MPLMINNLCGYMLTDDSRILQHGDRWSDVDETVYICNDIYTAKKILIDSEMPPFDEHRQFWNCIYRVHALRLLVDSVDHGLMSSRQASKIIVDRLIFRKNVSRNMSEIELLKNANEMSKQFFEFASGKPGRQK